MLNQQLYEYIKNLNKAPNEFTEYEVEDICIQHRALNSGKDWKVLASLICPEKTGEQLRQWALKRAYTRTTQERIGFEVDYKTQTVIRDAWNDYKRDLREDARKDALLQKIKEAVADLETLPKIEFNNSYDVGDCEAVLLFSDLHLGSEFSNPYNSYDEHIAITRVGKLLESVSDYCKRFNIHTLHFLNMGDQVAGLIHPTIRLNQQYDVVKQTLRASEIIATFLDMLKKFVPNITYRSVVDNHGRLTPNLSETLPSENLNVFIDEFVKLRLKNTNIKFPNDNLDCQIGKFVLKNGKKIIFSHGHNDKKQQVMQDMTGLLKEFPDIICMAHFHNSAEHTYQGTKVYISGSIIGTDPYAYNNRLFGKPEQKLLIFDNQNNIVDVDIQL